MAEHNFTIRQNLTTGQQDDDTDKTLPVHKLTDAEQAQFADFMQRTPNGVPDVKGLADEYIASDLAKDMSPCIITGDVRNPRVPVSPVQAQLLTEVIEERAYQDSIYGDASDRAMTEDVWLKVLRDYSNGYGRASKYDFETRMKKSAAICIAAREWFAAGGRKSHPIDPADVISDLPFLHQG